MPGGLLNIACTGDQNTPLTGNPSKSFFKARYSQHTNFGLQKFRVDFDGVRSLRMTESSHFTFKIPRYADLLMDCYVGITLPHIWSPIYPPQQLSGGGGGNGDDGVVVYSPWVPYEFRWIENIGAKMITNVTVTCGNVTLQEYSGDYILAAVQRDLDARKAQLFHRMTGHSKELNDPANAFGRGGNYPSAHYTPNPAGPEPSIRGRTLYVPLHAWFCNASQQAFPLAALQNNELKINVSFRPVREIFRVRDVADASGGYPYVAPDLNDTNMQFFRFVQSPPSEMLAAADYPDTRTAWDADIHLMCTYCFITDCERDLFVRSNQRYIVKQIKAYNFYDVVGTSKVEMDSHGMVSDYLFYFQRSDVNMRNEWSNYSNWPYNGILPSANVYAPEQGSATALVIGPGVNPDGMETNIQSSGIYTSQNEHDILTGLGILFDGAYRENSWPAGVYNLIEKYVRTPADAPDGLYCYAYGLTTSPRSLHPSGAVNMSCVDKVEFEFSTLIPPVDPNAQSLSICDPTTGEVIGTNKVNWRLYTYNYNLTVFEESINFVEFLGGNCGLMWAK